MKWRSFPGNGLKSPAAITPGLAYVDELASGLLSVELSVLAAVDSLDDSLAFALEAPPLLPPLAP